MVPLGEYLGEMTDELAEYGEEARLIMYVCTGAKSYGFSVRKADGTIVYCIKSKGFTLNWENGNNMSSFCNHNLTFYSSKDA